MAGLLGARTKLRGLLGQDPAPAVDPGAVLRERFGGAMNRQSLLSALEPRPVPERNRVSGWRVLDGVLGGKTVSESLDAERARETGLAQEQMGPDPRMMAIAQTIRDPRELALFAADPEAWSKNVGQQYAPQVVGAGAAQVVGGQRTVDQPQNMQSGDSIVQVSSRGASPVFTRTTPSIAEGIDADRVEVARIAATNPVIVAEDAIAIDPQTGRPVAQGNRSPIVLSDGAEAFTPDGAPIAQNAAPPPPQQVPANVQEAQTRISALDTDVFPVLDRQMQLLDSGLVITGLGADVRLGVARAQAALGDDNARRQVAATEEFIANAGRLRIGMAKSLGANPSNADIALLETVTAGNINVSSDGLRATIGQGRQLADRQRSAAQGVVGSPPQTASGAPVSVRSPEEAAALPRGTRFRTPDGREFVRQ